MGSVQRRALVTAMGWRLRYLFRDEFSAGAASLPRAAVPGPGSLTGVDSGGKLAVSGGVLTVAGTTGVNDPVVQSGPHAGGGGRAFITEITFGGTSNRWIIGWGKAPNVTPADGFYFSTSLQINPLDNGNQLTNNLDITLSTGVSYRLAAVLLTNRTLLLIKGDAFPAWTLLWGCVNSPPHATANYAGAGPTTSSTSSRTHDFMRVRDTALSEADGLVQAAPVSGTLYTASADLLAEATFTAPDPLANTAELRFRVQDDQNYWTAYFNAAGAFRVDSVSGGSATNRINVAGVMAAGGTRTIRVATNGSLISAFTKSGATWTRQGSTINVSHLNTQTNVAVVLGAGWSAANLVSFPRTSPLYNVLDRE